MTQRAVPFYCPYCGDETLEPYADKHGAWWCASCRRAWSLSLIGTGLASSGITDPPPGGRAGEPAPNA